MTSSISRRTLLRLSTYLAAGVSLAACSSSPPSLSEEASGQASSSSVQTPLTLTFANAAVAPSLDVGQSGTLETARISAQILEPLVRANINTGEPEASLATDWDISDDGLTYTFQIREHVQFHNGESLTPEAIVKNFQRWKKIATNTSSTSRVEYLQLFSAINSEDEKTSLVKDCSVSGNTVRFTLSRPSQSFLKALTQPAFGISAPQTIAKDFSLATLPTGTGAFKLLSWEQGTATLESFDSYWGDHSAIRTLVFQSIPDTEKRFVAMMKNEIDGYDLVGLQNYVPLSRAGNLTQPRDPYAICYININLKHPLLASREMRSAIAHAIDRSALVKKHFPRGTNVAEDFLPALFMMRNEETNAYYTFRKEITADRLKKTKYVGEPLEFYYPTGVSLPWAETPEAIYAAISADLARAGIFVKPKPIPWEEGYLDIISKPSTTRGLALTGFVGSYRDPNAFLSKVLAPTSDLIEQSEDASAIAPKSLEETEPHTTPSPQQTTESQEIISYREILTAIREADQLSNLEKRRQAYAQINKLVAQLMPAMPLCYPVSAVALGKKITYYPLSATAIENFAETHIRS